MGTLNEDLSAIKEVEDKIIANKVARFAYTDEAYTTNDAKGVEEYDVNKGQNIPIADASVLKVNETVLSKGYRAQASSVTRMLLNHFFGRMSYNLNKVNDIVSNLITTLIGHRGTANGFATLDENGRIPYSQLPESAMEYKGQWNAETNTPTLADGTGTKGDFYIVSVGGTQNLGSGNIQFSANDRIIYDGSVWTRLSAGAVQTVNNISPENGNVALTGENIPVSSTDPTLLSAPLTTDRFADSSVTTEKIADNAVTNAKIADNAVTTEKIADNAVTNAKIADNAVTNAKIADNTVTNAKIADKAVTNAKIKEPISVAKGGTGATDAKNGFINLASGLTQSTNPLDAEYMIYLTPNKDGGALYTLLQFWEYIKTKISSVLGLTATQYNGNAKTATTATTANTAKTAYSGMVYTCSTSDTAKEKTVSIPGFTLTQGACIRVKFLFGNSVKFPTLDVNGTGAHQIVGARGSLNTLIESDSDISLRSGLGVASWDTGTVLDLYYNGTSWGVIGDPIVKKFYDGTSNLHKNISMLGSVQTSILY